MIHSQIVQDLGGEKAVFGRRSDGAVRACADKSSWRIYRQRSCDISLLAQLILALSAGLIGLGEVGGVARAEEPSLVQIFSACRIPPRAAYGVVRRPSPESRKAHAFILAATRFKFTGDYDQAIEKIEQAIKVDPANPAGYLERGRARGSNHQVEQAVADLDHAISLDPTSSLAFLERARLHESMSEFGRAIEDYDEAIRLLRANPRGHVFRGLVRIAKREYDEAIEDFRSIDQAGSTLPGRVLCQGARIHPEGSTGTRRRRL